jgi:hypothetical protein
LTGGALGGASVAHGLDARAARALACCPAAAARRARAPLREVRAGGDAFELTVLEDLSRARDVFRSAQAVYSSTDRGLYVYPNSGPPRPARSV